MTTPRVSVCVATYNQEQYITDCLMSVVSQASDLNIEILVGDDNSSDRTSEIVKALSDQHPHLIKHIKHTEQIGPSKNYQTLIGMANGEYIAHLDGDDFWLPGKLRNQVNLLDQNPSLSAVYSNAICINDKNEPLGMFNNTQPEQIDNEYLIKKGNFLNHSSLVYRSNLRSEITSWGSFIDYRIHLHLARHGILGYLNSCCVAYRVGSSTSMIANQVNVVRNLYWEAISELDEGATKKLAQHAYADFLKRILIQSIKQKSPSLASTWLSIMSRKEGSTKLYLYTIARLSATFLQVPRRWASKRSTGMNFTILFWR